MVVVGGWVGVVRVWGGGWWWCTEYEARAVKRRRKRVVVVVMMVVRQRWHDTDRADACKAAQGEDMHWNYTQLYW